MVASKVKHVAVNGDTLVVNSVMRGSKSRYLGSE